MLPSKIQYTQEMQISRKPKSREKRGKDSTVFLSASNRGREKMKLLRIGSH